MTVEQRTTPEQRAALRERYAPDAVQTCGNCGHAMHLLGSDGYAREYVCSNQECSSRRVVPTANWTIIAALDDADALAGALAACERLRAKVAALEAEVDVLCDEDHRKMLELERDRAALEWYADPKRYLYRKAGDGPWLIKSEAHEDGGKIARSALAPQSGAPQNPVDYSHSNVGFDSVAVPCTKDAEAPKTGRYGRNTQGAADGRAR